MIFKILTGFNKKISYYWYLKMETRLHQNKQGESEKPYE